jgi:hypothetical protein
MGQANQWPHFLGLESAGLEPVPIEGDGACFFRAVADQLYGNQNEHLEIRECAVYYIMNRRPEFEPFLAPEAQPTRSCRKSNCNSPHSNSENSKDLFVQHLIKMLRPSEWATHLEVQATASSFGLEIHIHRPDQEMAQLIKGNLEGREGKLRRVDICFDQSARHYWSTRPVLKESVTVGEVTLIKGVTVQQVMLMKDATVEQGILDEDVAEEHVILRDPETEDGQTPFADVWNEWSRFLHLEEQTESLSLLDTFSF